MQALTKKQTELIFAAIVIAALVAILLQWEKPFGALFGLAASLSFAILIGALTGRLINRMNRAKK